MASDGKDTGLDKGQYNLDAIRKYEAVYGRGFVSPGGATTTRALMGLVALAPGARVLDVGSGLGGAAFLLARERGARVHGIDLSRNMVRLAAERCAAAGLAGQVTFERADVLRFRPPAPFDLAHSRDVFLHIHDKPALLRALAGCLRPRGQLLFTDYLCRAGPRSPAFAAYIAARGYDLRTLEEYQALLESAGLSVELAEDRTGEFCAILARELAGIAQAPLAPHERDELAQSWRDKLARAEAGEQRWGVFLARLVKHPTP